MFLKVQGPSPRLVSVWCLFNIIRARQQGGPLPKHVNCLSPRDGLQIARSAARPSKYVPHTWRNSSSMWVWVKIKPPGIGPQVLVHVATFQGNPFWYRLFEPLPNCFLWTAGIRSAASEATCRESCGECATKSLRGQRRARSSRRSGCLHGAQAARGFISIVIAAASSEGLLFQGYLPFPVFPGIFLFRKPSRTQGNSWFRQRTMVEKKENGLTPLKVGILQWVNPH